jgi:hypothetical protein
MEQSFYIGIRVGKSTHDALRKRQQASPIEISLSALVRHLLNESLGLKETNGKRRRR